MDFLGEMGGGGGGGGAVGVGHGVSSIIFTWDLVDFCAYFPIPVLLSLVLLHRTSFAALLSCV